MNFFAWQRRMLGGLLGWGSGSVVVGAGLAISSDQRLRQAGWQAIVWGGIDLAIAVAGRRGATTKERQQLDQTSVCQEQTKLRRILLLNVGLDACYLVAGWQLLSAGRRNRRLWGMGAGVLVQGGFLLIYDTLFVRALERRMQ